MHIYFHCNHHLHHSDLQSTWLRRLIKCTLTDFTRQKFEHCYTCLNLSMTGEQDKSSYASTKKHFHCVTPTWLLGLVKPLHLAWGWRHCGVILLPRSIQDAHWAGLWLGLLLAYDGPV